MIGLNKFYKEIQDCRSRKKYQEYWVEIKYEFLKMRRMMTPKPARNCANAFPPNLAVIRQVTTTVNAPIKAGQNLTNHSLSPNHEEIYPR